MKKTKTIRKLKKHNLSNTKKMKISKRYDLILKPSFDTN